MIKKKTKIEGAFIIKLKKNKDNRGFFEKQFCNNEFKKKKLNTKWKQINRSFNKFKYTFRGMHFQNKTSDEIKVVQCIKGKIVDVLFDKRKNSKTFLKTQCFQLSENRNELIYIPKGVAHGYLTLADNSELIYFHSGNHNKKNSIGINIMDKNINFSLKNKIKLISKKDKNLKFFNEL